MMFGRKPRHQCWPPAGIVFDPVWTCPECGATWRLEVHANDSEWVKTSEGAS